MTRAGAALLALAVLPGILGAQQYALEDAGDGSLRVRAGGADCITGLRAFRDEQPQPLQSLERTAEGWRLRFGPDACAVLVQASGARLRFEPEDAGAAGLRLRGDWALDAAAEPVRLEDSGDGTLQLRRGRRASARATAWLDPRTGRAASSSAPLPLADWEAGGPARLELPLAHGAWIQWEEHALQERFGLRAFAPLERARFPLPPCGVLGDPAGAEALRPYGLRYALGEALPDVAGCGLLPAVRLPAAALPSPSDRAARTAFERRLEELAHAQGAALVVLDGLEPRLQADPEAWRALLVQAHGAVGSDVPLLAGDAPLAGLGLLDGGCFAAAGSLASATRRGLAWNNLCWWSDPGPLQLGAPVPLEQARARATLLGLSGQCLWLADAPAALEPERLVLLQRVLPPQDLRPLDVYPSERPLRLLQVAAAAADGWPALDALAAFQDGAEPRSVHVSWSELGLEPEPRLAIDFWSARFLGEFRSALSLEVAPHACALVHLLPVPTASPALLTSGRHVAGPFLEPWALRRDSGELPGQPWLRTWEFAGAAMPGDARWLAFWIGAGPGLRYRVVEVQDEAGVVPADAQGPVLFVRPHPAAGRTQRLVLSAAGTESCASDGAR